MVLHDNKWDRRAKAKYMHKHGIARAAPEPEKPVIPAAPLVHSSLPDFDDDAEYEWFLKAARKTWQEKARTERETELTELTESELKEKAERQALFAEAARRVERSKLNYDVKTKLGKRQINPKQTDGEEIVEEDIDEFLDSLQPKRNSIAADEAGENVETVEIADEDPAKPDINEQEAFLDQLI